MLVPHVAVAVAVRVVVVEVVCVAVGDKAGLEAEAEVVKERSIIGVSSNDANCPNTQQT